jgi:hypothetical protein
MKRVLLPLIFALLTLSCVPGGGGIFGGGAAEDPAGAIDLSTNALSGGEMIAAPLGAAPDGSGGPFDGAEVRAASPDGPTQDPTAAISEPMIEPVVEEPPTSPDGVACVKRGDLWVHAGKSIAFTCVKKTRDSGKQCRKSTDCIGSCLARSMTCAPYDPLFGCNEILQDDGSRVTLCIE